MLSQPRSGGIGIRDRAIAATSGPDHASDPRKTPPMEALQPVLQLLQDNLPAVAVAIAAVLVVAILLGGSKRQAPVFLNAQQFQPLALARIDQVTHNTRRYVFELPSKKMRVGLPTGQHITFMARDAEGKDVYRPYTPTTDDDTLGSVEFVIKLYPTGKMSQILDKMAVGDSMLMKGPRGKFSYSRNLKRCIGERRCVAAPTLPPWRPPAWCRCMRHAGACGGAAAGAQHTWGGSGSAATVVDWREAGSTARGGGGAAATATA